MEPRKSIKSGERSKLDLSPTSHYSTLMLIGLPQCGQVIVFPTSSEKKSPTLHPITSAILFIVEYDGFPDIFWDNVTLVIPIFFATCSIV